MPFLRNAWYAAAWEEELSEKPLSRTILNEPIVVYRDLDGSPIALADRCPHRFAPLSRGKVKGSQIQCPYHGLTFDKTGACVHNPHGKGSLPAALNIKSYPASMSSGILWLWMAPENRPSSNPPSYEFLNNPEWMAVRGYLKVSANYELVTDNLLDLSHAEFLHPFLSTPGMTSTMRYRAEQNGDSVSAYHTMPNQAKTPLFQLLLDESIEAIDGHANMHWEVPANMMLDVGATALGQENPDRVSVPGTHLLTPETETSTHYFWSMARDRCKDNDQITEMLRGSVSYAFAQEDEPMIRAVQDRMAGRPLFELSPALLPMDEAAVRARRILGKRISDEQSVGNKADMATTVG